MPMRSSLLKYGHVNKTGLDKKLQALITMLEKGSPKKGENRQLMIYGQFIYKKIYLDLGPGLILCYSPGGPDHKE